MRLIDADALIEKIVNTPTECLDTFSVSSVVDGIQYGCASRQNEIIDYIKEQPTAYDVEAVVAELEKTKNECEPMYGGRSCGKEAKAIYAMALSYAISIVRGKE